MRFSEEIMVKSELREIKMKSTDGLSHGMIMPEESSIARIRAQHLL